MKNIILRMKSGRQFVLIVFLSFLVSITKTAHAQYMIGGGDFVVDEFVYSVNNDGQSVTLNYPIDGYDISGPLNIPSSIEYKGITFTVTAIGERAFEDCRLLTGTLSLPSTIKYIKRGAFDGCSGFSGTLYLPESLVSIETEAFMDCGIEDIHIPESVKEIGRFAFSNTTWFFNLPDGTIYVDGCCLGQKGNLEGDLIIQDGTRLIADRAFDGERFSGHVVFPNSLTIIGTEAFYQSDVSDTIVFPNSLVEIGYGAFEGCYFIKGELIIPNSVKSIGSRAFHSCHCIDNITLPDSVEYIGAGCFGFTTWYDNQPDGILYLGNYCIGHIGELTGDLEIKDGTTLISDYAFYNCEGLSGKLSLPSSLRVIGNSSFSGCKNLSGELLLPDSLVSIGREAFNQCQSLTGPLHIPNSVSKIGDFAFFYCKGFSGSLTLPNSITTIEQGAFASCDGLSNDLILPDGLVTIGKSAFSYCSGFTGKLSIPFSVKYIDDQAFHNCKGFNEPLSIPNTTIYIGQKAFERCGGISNTITIGHSVILIKGFAFSECTNVDTVFVMATTPPKINEFAFGLSQPEYYIGVPCGTRTDYCQNWSISSHKIFEECNLYPITVVDSPDGWVGASYSVTNMGNEVDIWVIPDEGMTLASLSVCSANDTTEYVALTNSGSSFFMPPYGVLIKATFEVQTSISEALSASAIVYPNPTNGKITIEAEDIKHIRICNMLGQCIYESKVNGGMFEYDFGRHKAGAYLIKIETENGITTKRVFVTR